MSVAFLCTTLTAFRLHPKRSKPASTAKTCLAPAFAAKIDLEVMESMIERGQSNAKELST